MLPVLPLRWPPGVDLLGESQAVQGTLQGDAGSLDLDEMAADGRQCLKSSQRQNWEPDSCEVHAPRDPLVENVARRAVHCVMNAYRATKQLSCARSREGLRACLRRHLEPVVRGCQLNGLAAVGSCQISQQSGRVGEHKLSLPNNSQSLGPKLGFRTHAVVATCRCSEKSFGNFVQPARHFACHMPVATYCRNVPQNKHVDGDCEAPKPQPSSPATADVAELGRDGNAVLRNREDRRLHVNLHALNDLARRDTVSLKHRTCKRDDLFGGILGALSVAPAKAKGPATNFDLGRGGKSRPLSPSQLSAAEQARPP